MPSSARAPQNQRNGETSWWRGGQKRDSAPFARLRDVEPGLGADGKAAHLHSSGGESGHCEQDLWASLPLLAREQLALLISADFSAGFFSLASRVGATVPAAIAPPAAETSESAKVDVRLRAVEERCRDLESLVKELLAERAERGKEGDARRQGSESQPSPAASERLRRDGSSAEGGCGPVTMQLVFGLVVSLYRVVEHCVFGYFVAFISCWNVILWALVTMVLGYFRLLAILIERLLEWPTNIICTTGVALILLIVFFAPRPVA